MTAVWIVAYVLAGIVSVPFLAHMFYDADGGPILSSKEGSIAMAIANALWWPLWTVLALTAWVSKRLALLIFKTDESEER